VKPNVDKKCSARIPLPLNNLIVLKQLLFNDAIKIVDRIYFVKMYHLISAKILSFIIRTTILTRAAVLKRKMNITLALVSYK
jgi:hypothetical protein